MGGETIMCLVQASKLDYERAREQLIRGAKNLPKLLPALDRWHTESRALRLQGKQKAVLRHLAQRQLPFRKVPEVEEWVRSFQEVKYRYKFLVLTGPSQMGKTQFAHSLAPGKTLELSMCGAVAPDLRSYSYWDHDVILFDEVSPSQILSQKKLFQAGHGPIKLGSSQTNSLTYDVWLHGKHLSVPRIPGTRMCRRCHTPTLVG